MGGVDFSLPEVCAKVFAVFLDILKTQMCERSADTEVSGGVLLVESSFLSQLSLQAPWRMV